MLWFLFSQLLSFLVDLQVVPTLPAAEKDLQLLLLSRQLRILQRTCPHPHRIPRVEKTILAVLTGRLKSISRSALTKLREVILIFRPETLLRWHRELVRRKWTFRSTAKPGRPPLANDIRRLIVRMAQDNRRWGYLRISGELLKPGYSVDPITVRQVLKRHHLTPAPQRSQSGVGWQPFLNHYGHQLLACDFLTVEMLWLQAIYVLFFIELGTHRVHLAGCTAHPTAPWVTQQARPLTWTLQDRETPIAFLIHDRDAKFGSTFDTVFRSEQIRIMRTPFRAPNANAYAERWIRSVRQECLDKRLIVSETHLKRVLTEYVTFYNARRPHQGIEHRTPMPYVKAEATTSVISRPVLGGILHDYYASSA